MNRFLVYIVFLAFPQTVHSLDLTLNDYQLTALIVSQMGQITISQQPYQVDKPHVTCHEDGRVVLSLDIHSGSTRLGRFRVSGAPVVLAESNELMLTDLNVELVQPEPYFTYTAAAHLARWLGDIEVMRRQLKIPLNVLPTAEFITFYRVNVEQGQITLSTNI